MGIKIENREAQFLIRLADTEIILGQRLTEMCSKGPFFRRRYRFVKLSFRFIW